MRPRPSNRRCRPTSGAHRCGRLESASCALREHGWGHCLTCTAPALLQNLLPEPCQEIRPVGLIMKDRLLVVATSGEVLEGARIFYAKLRAMNVEPRGREVQGQAMFPSPSCSPAAPDAEHWAEKKGRVVEHAP